jgi:hypothetical protein
VTSFTLDYSPCLVVETGRGGTLFDLRMFSSEVNSIGFGLGFLGMFHSSTSSI